MNRMYPAKTLRILALCAGLLPILAPAEDLSTRAAVMFKGTSSLHDFEGTVSSHPFITTFSTDAETGKPTVTANVVISVQSMTTNHKKRDKNMYKMFDLSHFKLIEAHLDNAPFPETDSGKVHLKLKIRNVERDVVATISDVQSSGNAISCKMSFNVSLGYFKIKAPSVLGIINVNDNVEVECTINGKVNQAVTDEETHEDVHSPY